MSVLEGRGFEVRAAANGQDALALFDQHAKAIDVVVTDMVMPEIGQTLGSTETVRSHVRNAMGKLDADTRTEAVAIAIRHSLID